MKFILGLIVGALLIIILVQPATNGVDAEQAVVRALDKQNAGSRSSCAGDLNNSGGVDVFDLFILLSNWGPCPGGCQSAGDCGPNQICQGNVCVCAPGYFDCDGDPTNGCEVYIDGDPNNCSACNVVCPPGWSCVNGTCVAPSGCQSAGDCGPNQLCQGNMCVCAPGYFDCDGNPINGCEVYVDGDPNNCSACNVVCPPGWSCVNGICVAP